MKPKQTKTQSGMENDIKWVPADLHVHVILEICLDFQLYRKSFHSVIVEMA